MAPMRAPPRRPLLPGVLAVAAIVAGLGGAGPGSPRLAAAETCPLDKRTADLVQTADELSRVDVHAAIAKYEEARASAPRSTFVLAKLAVAHEKREAWESALRTWGEACVLAPRHAGFAYGTARALMRLERWPQALDALSATLSKDERHAEAHASFAKVVIHLYERPQRDREAAVHLRRAIELAPDEASTYVALGDLLHRVGFPAEAAATFEAGLERARDDQVRLSLRLGLARVAGSAGDEVAALAHLEAASGVCADCTSQERRSLPFLLGSAYARARPPRKQEAVAQLSTFMKRVCKGAAAMHHRDACTVASSLVETLGPSP